MSTRMRLLADAAAVCLLAALLSPLSTSLQAQTGEEVMRTTLERYEERMQGVENYTVVQEVMGFESETYFEETQIDGHRVFVPRDQMGSEAARQAPDSPYASMFQLAERSEREGTEEVDGETCHVITVDDFEGVDLWNPAEGQGEGDFTPKKATFLVDADEYLIRRMKMSGTMTTEGGAQDVTFTAHMRDYRDVQGVVHPFEMAVSIEGVGSQMSAEEQAQIRESLEKMRSQMKDMPEQQRQMMERMMGGKLEKMEKMLAQGTMDFTVQVKEIRVNEGPPEDGG